jgi:hypothetical protein
MARDYKESKQPMNDTAVVLCTYPKTFSGDWHTNIFTFRDQKFPIFELAFDNQTAMKSDEVSAKYQGIPVTLFDDAFFAEHNFNRPISHMHRWGNHQNPKYFYAHFRMLAYYIKNPNYKYYWFFDDDVSFDGNLKQLLGDYEAYDDDFTAIQVFQKEQYIGFDRISVSNNRMGSAGNWLGFAPGPGDNYKSTDKHMGSFFPIVRYSNKSLAHLIELNKQGFFGYSEGFVPTSLASEGFSVSSMLSEHDKYFIKTNTNCILKHKRALFTWSWI